MSESNAFGHPDLGEQEDVIMRNKDVNRQVLKAISIGLTAALSLMPTVTAFADDDVDNGTDTEHHEESGANESHEVSEESASIDNAAEAVSEASEAIDTAESYCASPEDTSGGAVVADEASSDGADLFSSKVYDSLETAQDAVDSIGQDLTVLDGLNQAVESANEGVADALGTDQDGNINYSVVSTPVSNAGEKAQAADDSVKGAKDSVDSTSGEVADTSVKTSEAADAEYDSEAAAQSAKGAALQDLADIDAKIASDQKAVDNAQTAVNEAQTVLNVAQGAVDNAADALKKSQDAEKAAKDKLAELKEEWDFEIVNGEVVFGKKPADENRARAAIKSVTDALDQAKTETGVALENLVEANQNAEDAAAALQQAAKEKAEADQKAYSDYVASIGEDRVNELESMLAEIQAQRQLIKKNEEAGNYNDAKATYVDHRDMAALIVQYMLAQDPDVSSIEIYRDANGHADKVNKIGLQVTYVKDGETHIEYYNYKAIYRDGNEVADGEIRRRGTTELDHILVLKVADDKTESPFISENAINNGLDKYQSLRNAKTSSEAEYNKTLSLGDAEARLADAEAEAEAEGLGFLTSSEYKDRVDAVIGAINQNNAQVQSDFEKGTHDLNHNRELARSLVEYNLLQRLYKGEIEDYRFDTGADGKMKWATGKGVESNHGIVYILKDGTWTPKYFDYITYYDDGEVVNASGNKYQNNIGNYINSGRKLDHIVVVDKGTPKDNDSIYFNQKGEALITVAKVQSDLTKVQNVETARNNVNLAGLAAIEEAKKKVIAAVKALDEIKVTSAATAQRFNELKEDLKKAQDNYQNTLEAFSEAQTTLGETKAARDAMEKTINEGFNKIRPAAAEAPAETQAAAPGAEQPSGTSASDDGGSGSSGDEASGPSSDTVSAAAASSDGASVDITAPAGGAAAEAAGGAGVLGETAPAAFVDLGTRPSAVDAGAFADISDIESGVLDEGGDLLEEGVLGERMAPIVDAVNNGTFKRSMLFVEDGLQVSFMWWLIMLALGAKGVQMYVKSRRKEAKETEPEK